MLTFIKYLLSFLKNDWEFYDYPIQIEKQDLEVPELGRFKLVPWTATISNWGLFGGGNTKEEAVEMLKSNFHQYKQKNQLLPRPGTKVPITFASTDEINKHRLIARDFFEKILEMDFDRCFISDKSSIFDFPDTDEEIYKRIQQVYNVDVSDIKGGGFVDIFERISNPKV